MSLVYYTEARLPESRTFEAGVEAWAVASAENMFSGLGGPAVVLGSTNKSKDLSVLCSVAQHKQEQECGVLAV